MATLRLFAAAREAAGRSTDTFEETTVSAVLESAIARYGDHFARVLSYCNVMVDGESVAQGARDIAAVTSTTEVAILPPVAGGSLVRAAVLTVSDRASSGAYEDKSGPALVAMLQEAGYAIAATAVVPDDKKRIAAQVQTWCDASVDLVITTGGTGIASRDVTPEALTPLLTRELPGIVETMRAVGRAETPLADLSRQVAGTRDATLVLGVPGSIRGATTSLTAVLAVIPHALEMLQGNPE